MLWLWSGFFALVGVLLLLCRKTLASPSRHGAHWTSVWFLAGIAFAALVYPLYEHAWFGARLDEPSDHPGADAAMMFAAAYLLEYALAVDVAVVISFACKHHRVPVRYRPRVVLWALVAGVPVRIVILSGAAWIARTSSWTFYVLGAFFVYAAIRTLVDGDDEKLGDELTAAQQQKYMPLATRLWRVRRLSTELDYRGRFSLVRDGHRMITLAGACVGMIVVLDVLFALDSAIVVSVTTTTFIVVSSNLLATIAVRSWVCMPEVIERIRFPRISIVGLMAVVAAKLLTHAHVRISPAAWLAVIAAIGCAGVIESVIGTRLRRGG